MYMKLPTCGISMISGDLELEEDGKTCKFGFEFGHTNVELREVSVEDIENLIHKLVTGVAYVRTQMGIREAIRESQEQSP